MGDTEEKEKIEVPTWLSGNKYDHLENYQLLVLELLRDDTVSKETAIKIQYLSQDC